MKDYEKSEKIISTRYTMKEYNAIKEKATNNNQNVSTFIRRTVINACNNIPTDRQHNPKQESEHAMALKEMLKIKDIVEKNRNRITDELIRDLERRLENVWLTLK